jgi:hypothetical protein
LVEKFVECKLALRADVTDRLKVIVPLKSRKRPPGVGAEVASEGWVVKVTLVFEILLEGYYIVPLCAV